MIMMICEKGGLLSKQKKESHMSVSESLMVMFAFGGFILALLTYIHLTRKK